MKHQNFEIPYKGAIIVVYERHHFAKLIKLVKELGRELAPTVFYCPNPWEEESRLLAQAQDIGAHFIFGYSDAIKGNPALESLQEFLIQKHFRTSKEIERIRESRRKKKPSRLAEYLLEQWKDNDFQRSYRVFSQQAYLFELMVELTDAKIVILGENNVGRDSAVWAEVCRARDIPCVVYSTSFVLPERVAESCFRRPELQVRDFKCQLFSLAFPRWAKSRKGVKVLRLPLGKAVCMKIMGIAPKDPWTLNGSPVFKTLVDSEYTKDLYVKHRAKRNKIEVVGEPDLDLIFYRQNQDNEKTEVKEKSKVIIVSPPKNYYPDLQVKGHNSYKELLSKLNLVLKSWPGKVILAPHPGIPTALIEETFAYPVFKGATSEALSLGGIYLTAPSTTIKWSLALGLTTIIFDPYRFSMDELKTLWKGNEPIHDFDELSKRLSDISTLPSSPRKVSGYYGLIDGNSGERFRKVILEVIQAKR